jgi:hypothetical protein
LPAVILPGIMRWGLRYLRKNSLARKLLKFYHF